MGAGTRFWRARYDPAQATALNGLIAAGWTEAGAGLVFNAARPKDTLLLVSLSGSGEVQVGDAWRPCDAGHAYLAPAGCPRGKRSTGDAPWRHCWAVWDDPAAFAPGTAPCLFPASGEAFSLAIQGLYQEDLAGGDPDTVAPWGDLVLRYARRLARAESRRPSTLRPLWEAVLAEPAFPWSVGDLARRAALSDEALRVACRRETGRTPMGQVTFLRLRLAASLLTLGDETVAAVAARVGYADPYSFSTAFKRQHGTPPSRYRAAAFAGSPGG